MATKNSSSTRFYSNAQEEYIAKLLGAERTPNSGAGHWRKGDLLLPNWLIEAKTCTSPRKSFSIKLDWIEKNELERLEMHKPYSAIVFQFEPDGENYFVLSEKTFKKMLDKFEQE
jgi:hypothetical protein